MQTRYGKLAGLIVAGSALTFATSAQALTYDILIENMIPGGMDTGTPLTPPVAVVHDGSYSLFMEGGKSTDGLEVLAEEGMTMPIVDEANGAAGVSSVNVGDGPFFDMTMMSVEADPGDLLSIVMMLGRSNDLITGVHDVVLPNMGEMMMMTNVYDAGTEENTGMVAHIPFYGNTFAGPDEQQPISMVTMYSIVDDPDFGQIDFEFPPATRITITANPSTPTEAASWGAVKEHFVQ